MSVTFSWKMGMEAQIVEQLYKLVVKGIPVSFEPSGTAGLWVLEEANSLKTGTLNCTEWIKPPEKHHPRQCTAFLLLTISSIEQANQVLKGLTVMGWCVLVWHGLIEPRCCAKCQSNDAFRPVVHLWAPQLHHMCQGPPNHTKDPDCYSWNVPGHAAWDDSCPMLHAKVRAHTVRHADSGFRFFVMNNPETWVIEEQDLLQAPPPPTVWSQVCQPAARPDAGLAQQLLGGRPASDPHQP